MRVVPNHASAHVTHERRYHSQRNSFYGSVLAGNTGLRGGEIKKLRIGALDLENRRLTIRRADTKSDAGARTIELNRDAVEAAARLLLRASLLKPPATEPEHYLMPKYLSRIAHGEHKGELGYDPTQHQQYWDTAWHSLTEKAGFPALRFHDLRHTFITHMVELGFVRNRPNANTRGTGGPNMGRRGVESGRRN
jgi:integrase